MIYRHSFKSLLCIAVGSECREKTVVKKSTEEIEKKFTNAFGSYFFEGILFRKKILRVY